jgi:hypothetical protein
MLLPLVEPFSRVGVIGTEGQDRHDVGLVWVLVGPLFDGDEVQLTSFGGGKMAGVTAEALSELSKCHRARTGRAIRQSWARRFLALPPYDDLQLSLTWDIPEMFPKLVERLDLLRVGDAASLVLLTHMGMLAIRIAAGKGVHPAELECRIRREATARAPKGTPDRTDMPTTGQRSFRGSAGADQAGRQRVRLHLGEPPYQNDPPDRDRCQHYRRGHDAAVDDGCDLVLRRERRNGRLGRYLERLPGFGREFDEDGPAEIGLLLQLSGCRFDVGPADDDRAENVLHTSLVGSEQNDTPRTQLGRDTVTQGLTLC